MAMDVIITVRLPEEDTARIQACADRRGITRSEFVRKALMRVVVADENPVPNLARPSKP